MFDGNVVVIPVSPEPSPLKEPVNDPVNGAAITVNCNDDDTTLAGMVAVIPVSPLPFPTNDPENDPLYTDLASIFDTRVENDDDALLKEPEISDAICNDDDIKFDGTPLIPL